VAQAIQSSSQGSNSCMKLSICIPTYNRITDLKICLVSVIGAINLLGSSDVVEILISDNASDDGTAEYIHSLPKTASNYIIHAWTNEFNVGGVCNVKKLMEAATGEYLFMLTDDDYLTPNALLILYKYLDVGYEFIKTAIIINLIASKSCSFYGTKEDLSDAVNSENFFEIMKFSHVLSGCIIKNRVSVLLALKDSRNAYPSIEMCALSAGKCISIAEPLVIHQWENPIAWEVDVDMSTESSRKRHLERDVQLALTHLDDSFFNMQQARILCRYFLDRFGYIESAIHEKFGKSATIELKKFKRKRFLGNLARSFNLRRWVSL